MERFGKEAARNMTTAQVVEQVIKADTVVDLQLGYEIQGGSYKGLSFLLQVNNLTNAAFQTFSGSEDRYRGWEKYGRQTLLGVNYKL